MYRLVDTNIQVVFSQGSIIISSRIVCQNASDVSKR